MELELQTFASDSSSAQAVLSDEVFGRDYNEPLIHQVVTAFLAGGRSGTKAQKSRSDVRGGGRKPWAQKGSGRARAGTSRSPIWRSGGATFAARPRDFSEKVNRKMYRGAMRSILSELLRKNRLIAVEGFPVDEPKTKIVIECLKTLGVSDALIICSEPSENLILATCNIPNIGLIEAATIDPAVLVAFKNVIVTREALEEIEGMLK
ncbi:MAG: 50S ribosomal protein L4 [Gammaproteobacteria bacterium]|jgi:large subunit ribosomal protein L4|nr:50S ribosomal protein L4 [Pseudomonadota bacterium]MDG2301872.1 50S ribosomal protein L4 [Gammaproteobacteria bacterium]MBT5066683.1 50S ribosomal protein L4 [Pseudomonadota bacterium]MBT6192164.1 50S ribosomal protein L4 [Pseudomonadota bacterium]MBT6465811.1 50S ribosomal protein L4 [Pseudomonadota bacterium]|tara:strand:- start:449 stop:1069 length:621 start_codon:yes stop_codon:yes gene_type:complete